MPPKSLFLCFIYFCSFCLICVGCSGGGGGGGGSFFSSGSSSSGNVPTTNTTPNGTGNPGTAFNPFPTLSSVSPFSGPPDVPTTVTISGMQFLPGTQVSFGGISATNITIIDATTIVCSTPLGSANTTVDVAVTSITGNTSVLANAFTYVFLLTSLSITNGRTEGGDSITLTGDGFAPNAQVFFDAGISATNVSVLNRNTIICTSPAGIGGETVDVIVRNTQGEEAILLNAFLYAEFIVTTTANAGAGSLRQAVLNAQALPGVDTIVFSPSLMGATINITAEMFISQDTNIVGPGSSLLTIDAGGTSRFFFTSTTIPIPPYTFRISGLTLSNGFGSYFGATSTSGGGAIAVLGGDLIASDCVFSENDSILDGGAIWVGFGGKIFIDRCTFFGNFAVDDGGAIFTVAELDNPVNITNSTFDSNSTSPGSIGAGGGAIYFSNALETYTISGCTFVGNTSGGHGGAINNALSTLTTFTNCTFSGNSSEGRGGAVYATDFVVLNFCTVTLNTSGDDGGGVSTFSSSAFLYNTIIAENIGFEADDIFGSFGGGGYILIGVYDTTYASILTSTGSVNLLGTVASPLDPLLGSLLNNGGVTNTHALLLGSPAINAGNPSSTGFPVNDQRDLGYPRILGGRADIGAFEY